MKRIVVCCDGTWNRWDREWASNVVKIARAISPTALGTQPGECVDQVVFYDEGVGTGDIIDRLRGGAFGDGLDANVAEAYRFLVNNYEEGDEIYLFGFSRGAYTVRSTNGLIRKCGLLRERHGGLARRAMDLYRRRDPDADQPDVVEFRQAHSHANPAHKPGEKYSNVVDVQCIGVWDTVGSLGIPLRSLRWWPWNRRYRFHDHRLSGNVKHAYHAVAIDERRGTFPATLWDGVPRKGQVVEQVWFSGVHNEVGGGCRDTGLSDLTLAWMVEKANSCGLAFDQEQVKTFVAGSNPSEPVDQSLSGLYRFLLPETRRMGLSKPGPAGVGSEALHPSVCVKYNATGAPSVPANLAEYLRHPGRRLADVPAGPWRDPALEHWPNVSG